MFSELQYDMKGSLEAYYQVDQHCLFYLQEEEDQDWARAEALRESRTVEEVVFTRATSNGMLVRYPFAGTARVTQSSILWFGRSMVWSQNKTKQNKLP